MWLDPRTRTYVILLTSRLHPRGTGNVSRLRHAVGSIAAEMLRKRPWPLRGLGVRTGLDVIAERIPGFLQGRKLGLITNHTGRDRRGRSAVRILKGRGLRTLFSPEHGIGGIQDSKIEDSTDPETGLRIYSLYGAARRPDAASLKELDALVFDIQDIGTRFYTYVSTMVNCMEEAAEEGLSFVVLDRPNPIGGTVEGPVADADALDFVGRLRIPIRHGMTVGEIARLARKDLGLDLDLRIVKVSGWMRRMHHDDTGLPWVNPSPNIRNIDEALLYPGVGLIETTNVSVGRGTPTPFEHIGAPWMNGPAVAEALSAADLTGVGFRSVTFTPSSSKHAGVNCSGVQFTITDRDRFRPVRMGITLASILQRLHAENWDTSRLGRLVKHRATVDAIRRGESVQAIEALWSKDRRAFLDRRRPFLIYK